MRLHAEDVQPARLAVRIGTGRLRWYEELPELWQRQAVQQPPV
jgi:hypothetical protein